MLQIYKKIDYLPFTIDPFSSVPFCLLISFPDNAPIARLDVTKLQGIEPLFIHLILYI